MSRQIRVMHVINNLNIGGAEKILVLLLNKLSENPNFKISLVLLEGDGVLLPTLSKKIEVKRFKYKVFHGRLIGKLDPMFRVGLWRYSRKFNPDVIHGHLIKSEDFAKMLGIVLHKPVVVTWHDAMIWPGIKTRLLNRFGVSSAIAVSKTVAKYIEETQLIENKKIQIIPNAIDMKLFRASAKKTDYDKPIFLHIGRLLEIKGVHHSIKALSKLRRFYPNLEFLIYGKETSGEYKDRLQKLLSKEENNFAKLMGPTDDVPGALAGGDIFLLPSKTEGFAISVLEAAASGKPIVATRVGAIPDMVKEGKNGYFVGWGKPDQIFAACKNILDNKLVESMGKESAKIASQSFDIDNVVERHAELYSTLGSDHEI